MSDGRKTLLYSEQDLKELVQRDLYYKGYDAKDLMMCTVGVPKILAIVETRVPGDVSPLQVQKAHSELEDYFEWRDTTNREDPRTLSNSTLHTAFELVEKELKKKQGVHPDCLLSEIQEYLVDGEHYDSQELIADWIAEIDIEGKVLTEDFTICSLDDEHLLSLGEFAELFYSKLIEKVHNVLESFKEEKEGSIE